MKTELERYKEAVRVAQADFCRLQEEVSSGRLLDLVQRAMANINAILNPPPEADEVLRHLWCGGGVGIKTELERHKEALSIALRALESEEPPVCLSRAVKDARKKIEAILNPPPEMEEVEVVKYQLINKKTGAHGRVAGPDEPYDPELFDVVTLTGTYKRPKPQPVEKIITSVVQWVTAEGGYIYPASVQPGYPHWEDIAGKIGTLTFTWTEPAE